MTRQEIEKKRKYSIRKRNDFIQHAKYDLSAQQLKVLAYVFSKISADDTELKTYTITIREFCELTGINDTSGGSYQRIKATLKNLCDKSFWMYDEEKNADVLVRWIDEPEISHNDGTIRIRLKKYIQQFVIDVNRDFTDYPFLMVLPMRSSYSIRIYELMKSVEYQRRRVFEMEELRHLLFGKDENGKWSEPYLNFKDFRKNVLEPAEKEINQYTDLSIAWEPIRRGNKVVQISFMIRQKSPMELLAAMRERDDKLNKCRRGTAAS